MKPFKAYFKETDKDDDDLIAGIERAANVYKITEVYLIHWSLEDAALNVELDEDGNLIYDYYWSTRVLPIEEALGWISQCDEAQGNGFDQWAPEGQGHMTPATEGNRIALINSIENSNGAAVFTEPHTHSYYVLGRQEDATLIREKARELYNRTMSELDDIMPDWKQKRKEYKQRRGYNEGVIKEDENEDLLAGIDRTAELFSVPPPEETVRVASIWIDPSDTTYPVCHMGVDRLKISDSAYYLMPGTWAHIEPDVAETMYFVYFTAPKDVAEILARGRTGGYAKRGEINAIDRAFDALNAKFNTNL